MSESDTGYIYTLSDPRTGEPRYVGKTTNPRQRFRGHIYSPHNMTLARWIKRLKQDGQTPIMHIIDVVSDRRMADAEREAINRIRREFSLLNTQQPFAPDANS